MSIKFQKETAIDEKRYLWASVLLLVAFMVLTIRLWYVQVYRGDYYLKISENNRIRKIEIPAPRGNIYDRNGQIILGNRPFYDLVYIPQYAQDTEQSLKILSHLLNTPYSQFDRALKNGRGRPEFMPILLKRNLSTHEVSLIETNRLFLPGIEISMVPRRDYSQYVPSHLIGYMGEISKQALEEYNSNDLENPYLLGDLVGKQGLEVRWEKFLRGKRGYKLIQVDAFGRQSKLLEHERWSLPVYPAKPGSDLILTLDMGLQNVAKEAFEGKNGAVIALNPNNGEILVMLSSPEYDPSIYQSGLSSEEWLNLTTHPFKPLLDKTTGGAFMPGSVYKPLLALAALEEGVVKPEKAFGCNGSFRVGNTTFHCWVRHGHGYMDMTNALVRSCDVYFFHLGLDLGVDTIAKYARSFGLGSKLDVGLNYEHPGLIPTTQWKREQTKTGWALGDIPSMAIGQGANLLTPMQIATMYAAIANGGKVWRPFVVRHVADSSGDIIYEEKPKLIREVGIISERSFAVVRDALEKVVSAPTGTAKGARVKDHTVAGKTGSVQVVSLKKSRNRNEAMSMKWQEHALFASFSPAEKAEIVVIVVSENDTVGGGGAAAAPIAQKILQHYWDSKDINQQQAR